ncbi:MAG: hypothetical protein HY815_07585 [Candidatus Riflebacteria bacterium]|nr:hypothetical protein [Candidatus Riflebacteria bacterium]
MDPAPELHRVPPRTWRLRALSVLALSLSLAGLLGRAGLESRAEALRTEAAWRQARSILPVSGCAICGKLAVYDVSRLQRKNGKVVAQRRVGLRCEQHKEAESIAVESGRRTAHLLVGLALIIGVFGSLSSLRASIADTPHMLWPATRMRPASRAYLALAAGLYVTVPVYALWVGFKDAYLTVPLWLTVGGMLCAWLYELLRGGEYVRCDACDFGGNLADLEYFQGLCPACGSSHFRLQELLSTERSGTRTTYRYRMMVGLDWPQIQDLSRRGRIWKEPRGQWAPASPLPRPGASPGPSRAPERDLDPDLLKTRRLAGSESRPRARPQSGSPPLPFP